MPTIPQLPANLASDCEELSKLEDGKAGTILMWNVTNIPKAVDCKHKHAAIREAYNNMRGVLLEFSADVEKAKKK